MVLDAKSMTWRLLIGGHGRLSSPYGLALHAGELYIAEQGRLTLGLLPLSAISNGHTYFVQHPRAFCAPPCSRAAAAPHARPSPPGVQMPPGVQEPSGVQMPLGVHTTFQFGDSAGFAFGKRERLRQALHIPYMGAWVHGNT